MIGETKAPEPAGSVLVVEDDQSIARMLELELRHNGYVVERAADGDVALKMAQASRPDIIILDLMLPGVEGLDVSRTLRAGGYDKPILMLTARSQTGDVVEGFDAGADDYLRKPFEMPELLSRMSALLKRHARDSARALRSAAGVEIDVATRRATIDGRPLDLTAKEFDLLAYLVANAGRPVTREEIIAEVWAGQHTTDSNVIEVFMCHLRGKLGKRGNKIIQTIRGVGYFFARS